jgi:hypothetical protein
VSATDRTIYWSRDDGELDLDDLYRELDEALVNYLTWSDLPTRADVGGNGPGGSVFFSDVYFSRAAESERDRTIHACPLPEVEDEQEQTVIRLWGEMTASDRDVIQELAADGGRHSRDELADSTGWSYRTVRRVVDRCEEVLRDSYEGLELASDYMADELIRRVRTASDALQDGLATAAMEAADAAQGRLRDPWTRVTHRYNVDVQDSGAGPRPDLRVRYEPVDQTDAKDVIQDLRRAARDRYGTVRGITVTLIVDGQRRTIQRLQDWTRTGWRLGGGIDRDAAEKLDEVDWEAHGYEPIDPDDYAPI